MTKTNHAIVRVVVLVILSLAKYVTAQEPPKQAGEDVIKIDTALVQVRAVVTDKSGKVVDNLKQDDFEILENGKPQRVGFFSLEKVSPRSLIAAEASQTSPSKPLTPAANAKPQRFIVLFVDTLHLTPVSLTRAKDQLKKFIDQKIGDEDLVAVVTTTNSLGILNQFMRDRSMLKRAIDKIDGFGQSSSFLTPYIASRALNEDPQALAVAMGIATKEENLQFMTAEMIENYTLTRARQIISEEEIKRQNTLQVLKAVAEKMATMPGERMIAFMSDGFTLLGRSSGLENQDLTAATSQAVRAGVVIYSFNPQGLTAPAESSARAPIDSPEFSFLMADSLTDSQSTLRTAAADTGGEAYLNSNDMVGQMKKMLDANEVYYAISYYPEDRQERKYRNIKVSVKNHPEYKVRTQRGYQYVATKPSDVATTPRQKVLQAILAPLPVTTIPVIASASFLERSGEDEQVWLQVHVSGDLEYKKKGDKFDFNCEVVVVVIDHAGKVVGTYPEPLRADFTAAQLESAKQSGYRYGQRLKLAPGLYQIRVGFRDVNSEHLGTANAWIEVPDLHRKKLTLSSIFLGRESEEKNAGEKKPAHAELVVGPATFKATEPIYYRFVVYRAGVRANESDLNFKVEILDGETKVYDGDWQSLAPRIIRKDSQRSETGGVLRTNIDPGFYTLRISVKDAKSKQTIQQTIDFELDPKISPK